MSPLGERGRSIWGMCLLLAAGCGGGHGSVIDAALAGEGGADDASPARDASPTVDAGRPDAAATGTAMVYVGGNQISIFGLDLASGALTPKGTMAAGKPSFLAVNPTRTALYAVDEQTAGKVSAFAIAPGGGLTALGSVSSGGQGPAHVSVDRTGRWVLAANYGSGQVAVLPVQAGGGLGAATDVKTAGANAHLIVVDAANRFAFVPCLGTDRVVQYAFDASLGKLTPNVVPALATAAGAGPRHLDFRPGGGFAYLIDEKSDTMSALGYDAAAGQLSELQTVSALPAGVSGAPNTGAEVAVHPSGKFVYGSNRGNDSIVIFSIDPSTGRLTLVGHVPTGGTTPRHFSIDPAGNLLLVANQGSGNIVAFRINPTTGGLTSLGPVATVTAPTYVGIVVLP